jgi:hypothetical protein
MASDVDEQPPSRPPRPRPEAPRRRPPSRSEIKAAQRRAVAPPRRPVAAPASRRPPVSDDVEPAPPPAPRSQNKLIIALSVATVVVIGLIALAVAISNRSSDDGIPPAAKPTEVPTTTFKDTETGFTVQYPRSWHKVDVPVADYRLAVDGGNEVAFTIRVVPIQTPATAENLENFKAVTDGLVVSNSTVKVLKNQAISLNGMLGYYYFYTFQDGGVDAVHAHYFLFSGNKMNVLVFQALPDDFQNMAATFDKIAESFKSDPNIPSAAATSNPTTSTTAR